MLKRVYTLLGAFVFLASVLGAIEYFYSLRDLFFSVYLALIEYPFNALIVICLCLITYRLHTLGNIDLHPHYRKTQSKIKLSDQQFKLLKFVVEFEMTGQTVEQLNHYLELGTADILNNLAGLRHDLHDLKELDLVKYGGNKRWYPTQPGRSYLVYKGILNRK